MRLAVSTVMLALLLGAAPALTQESPGILPTVAQSEAKAARAQAGKHPVHRKAAPNIAAPETVSVKTIRQEPGSVKSEPAIAGSTEISPGDRMKIQSALLWSGDYTGSIGGEDPFLSAIKNYQKRAKSRITGILSASERANLLTAAKSYEDEFGWTIVTDPSTGARLGLPAKLVPQVRDAARGTRWSATHGEVQVETFRIPESEIKLTALFEQQKKEPTNRKVESSALRDDGFTISGMQGLKIFSVRAQRRDGEIRGLILLFDQMMETIVAGVSPAIVSAFSPFPERSMPFAAMAKPVEYGNGLVVSSGGHIVTDRSLASGCQVIVVAGLGDADRVAEDPDSGLAMLRVYGVRDLTPLAFASDASNKGYITLVGIPDPKEQNGAKKLTEIKARLTSGNAIELRQSVPMAGFSGAAALDAQGRVLGLTEMRNFVLASIEPAAPPVRLITADTIRNFLIAHNVVPAQQAGDARASVVRIICVRK